MPDQNNLIQLVEKMYIDMQNGFKQVNSKILKLDEEVASIKEDVASIKKNVIKIEQEHGEKLSALFDGYTQNSQKLVWIESEVQKHEEFILKRIK